MKKVEKKFLLILIIIFPSLSFSQKKGEEERVSISASIGTPHYGIKSLNHEPMGSFSYLWHGKDAGAGVLGGFQFAYNIAFKYHYADTHMIKNLHTADAVFGLGIPRKWNKYVSGPAVLFAFGVGFKAEGDPYPNVPVKFAMSLQQNGNIPVQFLDNLTLGFFARGTLGTMIYKDLNLDSGKSLKNNYFGIVEAGIRLSILRK